MTILEYFKDSQDQLDSGSELLHGNSEFHAHQENSKEYLPMLFQAPEFYETILRFESVWLKKVAPNYQ